MDNWIAEFQVSQPLNYDFQISKENVAGIQKNQVIKLKEISDLFIDADKESFDQIEKQSFICLDKDENLKKLYFAVHTKSRETNFPQSAEVVA